MSVTPGSNGSIEKEELEIEIAKLLEAYIAKYHIHPVFAQLHKESWVDIHGNNREHYIEIQMND